MTFPGTSTTVAGLGIAQTFTAANTISTAGALSASPLAFTGALLNSGGSGTTTFPQILLSPTAATTESGWSTSGTWIGINSTAFSGNFLDFHINNAAAAFQVASTGVVNAASYVAGAASAIGNTAGTSVQVAATGVIGFSATGTQTGAKDTTLCRSAAGVLEVGSSTGCASSGSLTAAGIIGGSFQQQAASNSGGTCAMVAGTSCTITIGHSYTTPVCIATQQSATLTGGAVGCTVSGTTVTITSAVINSETWGAFVFGNPN
jgi:hypothetical protein